MSASRPLLLSLAITAALVASAAADASVPFNAALRYRFEQVDDDAFTRDASAHTVRLRLGWKRAWSHGWETLLEAEGVSELNDRFNSTANRQTSFPVVADARALELNQAILGWSNERARVGLGRQRITLDNQRFIGNVGWRQNEQTFDALSLSFAATDAINLRYHWLDRVHRVNGDDAIDRLARERRLDAHLLNGTLAFDHGTLAGYSYLVEDKDVAAASSRTLGLRWSGSLPPTQSDAQFGWTIEVAQQDDHGNNPTRFSHDYLLLEPRVSWHGISWKLGFERLDGDGTHAFQTPLATLHAFNGWADKFLVTPAAGLEDRYLGADGKFGHGTWQDRFSWSLLLHDFQAARGDADYGREWDASLGIKLGHGWNGLLKMADYRSDGFARDTGKWWVQFEWSY